MTPDQQAKIAALISDANSDENAGTRAKLLDRYLAEPYGNEVAGRSKFVDSAAADAVEAMLPDLMDVFTSAERLVEFKPVGPEDEDAADQETEVVHHIFAEKNPGFSILYTWVKEALIQQNSYVWHGWCDKPRVEIEEYEGLTAEEFFAITEQIEGEYEVLEQSGFETVVDPETGEPVVVEDGEGIAVKLRITRTDKEYLIDPFPQEDFFITPRWPAVSLDGVPCCGRRHRDKTKEDLIALGLSESSIENLAGSSSDDEEASARHHTRDLDESEQSGHQTYEVLEAYLRFDLDGDGTAELLRAWTNGDGSTVLEWKSGGDAVEEVGAIPIKALTPYIMPHRHHGRSVVEQVDDIQEVNTVLTRHTLDSVYASLYARPHFDENEAGENTFDDLANPAHGAPVRTGGAEIIYPMAGAAGAVSAVTLPLLEKFQALQEQRVGATRYNQGLDADSLNKTASGIKQIMGASQKKTKLVARTIAETGLRDLFLGIHRDLRAGPLKELVLKLKGKWVAVNPRLWKERTDMRAVVGMGRGDRDEKRAGFMALGQVQRELVGAGSRLVDETRIFNSVKALADTFGIDGIERFVHDPAQLGPPPPPPPPPPDPIMISAQAQAQKVQADAQIAVAKLQADEAERERKHAERMAELRIREMELANRIENEREQLELKAQEAVMRDDLERDKLDKQTEPPVGYEQVTKD